MGSEGTLHRDPVPWQRSARWICGRRTNCLQNTVND